MYVTRHSSLCNCLTSTKFGSKAASVCLQGLWQEVYDQQQHQQAQEACMWPASPKEELLQLFHVGQGGGQEKGASGQFQERGRHPLPSQFKI